MDPDGEAQPPPFSSHTAAVPFVREAMAAWSRIPTADIRWRLTGVASGPGIGQDGRNAITVNADLYGAGHAQRWHRRADSGRSWEVFECDIQLHPGAAAFLGPDDIVGASLSRPAGDWARRTGAITGRVTASGAPARFVAVGSVQILAAGQTAPGPGAFTDEDGRFRLEAWFPAIT